MSEPGHPNAMGAADPPAEHDDPSARYWVDEGTNMPYGSSFSVGEGDTAPVTARVLRRRGEPQRGRVMWVNACSTRSMMGEFAKAGETSCNPLSKRRPWKPDS